MDIVTYTHARQNLKSLMDKVTDNAAPVIITRGDNPPVVMLSMDEFERLDETAYLTRSPANKKALDDALARFKSGRRGFVTKTMDELRALED